MKNATLKLTTLLLVLVSLVNKTNAQSGSINVVTTAVPFLRISPDARAGGMADAGIATSSDAFNSYWNLAKTPFSTTNTLLGATYTPWLQDLGVNDLYMVNIGGIHKLDDQQGISGSVRYFSLGSIQATTDGTNNYGTIRPFEFSIDGGYSRKLSDKLALGVGLRYIRSNLTNGSASPSLVQYQAATAVSGDIHLFYNGLKNSGEGFTYGVTLSNLGSKISYTSDATNKDYIPANLGLGAAYTKIFDADDKITFTINLNKLLVPVPPASDDSAGIVKYHTQSIISSWFNSFSAPGGFKEELDQIDICGGAEYWYQNQFALRAGYFYENPNEGDRQYFTLGAGLKYNTFALDFYYLLPSGTGITRQPLSNTLRFSVLFNLDQTNSSASK